MVMFHYQDHLTHQQNLLLKANWPKFGTPTTLKSAVWYLKWIVYLVLIVGGLYNETVHYPIPVHSIVEPNLKG